MQFEPIGGFPPIVRIDDTKASEKTLESRGFATTNIVNINSIMDTKKKENLFIAFGTEEEEGIDLKVEDFFNEKPHDYQKIIYKEPAKPKKNKSKSNSQKLI